MMRQGLTAVAAHCSTLKAMLTNIALRWQARYRRFGAANFVVREIMAISTYEAPHQDSTGACSFNSLRRGKGVWSDVLKLAASARRSQRSHLRDDSHVLISVGSSVVILRSLSRMRAGQHVLPQRCSIYYLAFGILQLAHCFVRTAMAISEQHSPKWASAKTRMVVFLTTARIYR
jgi:hypothetical protein